MTFLRSWVLLFALLPALWAILAWRRTERRTGLVLKALALLCVVLAIAEPELRTFESRVAVAVLADTSASIPQQDLARESGLAAQIRSLRGRNWTQVIPFAQATRALSADETGQGFHLKSTAGASGKATNIEAAVREGIAALPAGRVPRLVIISDGKENFGNLARAAWQARELGIPIDTVALAGRPKPDLHLDSVTMPNQAFTGERFPIDIVLSSPRRAKASVEITAAGKPIGASELSLQPGTNRLRIHASLSTPGALDLAGSVTAPGLGSVRFVNAIALRRPRVLLVTQDPPGTETHLTHALEAGQFEVAAAASVPSQLDDFQIAVLNNMNVDALPAARQRAVEQFVKQGGGLLMIGGERNIYVEQRTEGPIDRTLPARLAPPRTPEGTCVVLILDKSSSMEGRKMELAKLAAVGVVDNLRPVDFVGVLIFDNSFHWSVPIRRAEERGLIRRVISGITPDGGTQIAPALQEAYRRILPINAVFKHIVLLTDGISEEGDSMTLAREAAERQVTISTVGLGQDVNRAYLEKVANLARGKSYFLNDPAGLEQILLRDVMEHTGSTAVERAIRPQIVKKAEILDGIAIESAPPLQGFVRFIAKPTADVILNIDRTDPLFVRWQYGLGRAAIFSSDAKSRWAKRWVSWEGFDRFWGNVFRDLLPHARAGEATAEYDSASDEIVVDYRLGRAVDEPAPVPDVFLIGPNKFERPMKLEKVAQGAYRARVRIDRRQGLFRIRPLIESRAFPEVGVYRQEAELADYGSNEPLLREIAEFTGGRFNPDLADIFDAGGRRVPSTLRLWPGLVALAVLLNLLELILRKWRGIAGALRRRTVPQRETVTVAGSTS